MIKTPENQMTEPTKRPPTPPKALAVDALPHPATHYYREWFVDVRHLDVEVQDLFTPSFWRNHTGGAGRPRLRIFDVVRCVGRGFDLLISVSEIAGHGCAMVPHNWVRPGSQMAQMLDVLTGPDGPAAVHQAVADAELAGMRGAA